MNDRHNKIKQLNESISDLEETILGLSLLGDPEDLVVFYRSEQWELITELSELER